MFASGCNHDRPTTAPADAAAAAPPARAIDLGQTAPVGPPASDVAVPGQPGFAERRLSLNTPPAATPVVVKRGRLPLVYLVESPGHFTVADADGGSQIADADADGQSIISVGARVGVKFGARLVKAGPLDDSRAYSITYVPPENFGQRVIRAPEAP